MKRILSITATAVSGVLWALSAPAAAQEYPPVKPTLAVAATNGFCVGPDLVLVASVSGFTARENVVISTPNGAAVTIATIMVDATGAGSVRVPSPVAAGGSTLAATGATSRLTATTNISVVSCAGVNAPGPVAAPPPRSVVMRGNERIPATGSSSTELLRVAGVLVAAGVGVLAVSRVLRRRRLDDLNQSQQ